MAQDNRAVEPALRNRLFDVFGQHVEAHVIDRRAFAIAQQIERDRLVARGAKARDLRVPQPRRADDPLQEDDGDRS